MDKVELSYPDILCLIPTAYLAQALKRMENNIHPGFIRQCLKGLRSKRPSKPAPLKATFQLEALGKTLEIIQEIEYYLVKSDKNSEKSKA